MQLTMHLLEFKSLFIEDISAKQSFNRGAEIIAVVGLLSESERMGW